MRAPSAPFQWVTPRLRSLWTTPLLCGAGSNAQISRPLAASSATARMAPVVMNITPSTTSGLTCIVAADWPSPV
jgi:hypothetical protein